RQLEPPSHVLGANEAEVARAHRRQQLETDVRWRYPHRRFWLRILLKIVRGEPMRARVGERVEVLPVKPRIPHREAPLVRRKLRSPGRRGLAENVRDRWRETPQPDEWEHDGAEKPASAEVRMCERTQRN